MAADAAQTAARWEAQLQRNPHPDFKATETSRPPFDTASKFRFTQTVSPTWKFGDGANNTSSPSPAVPHVTIDPYAKGRSAAFNYKLLISAVVPRPIAFLSTRSKDGTVTNLAPFSYFQLIAHDPPMFVVGFSTPLERAKDSLRNLTESGECVINVISEGYVEAANSASINAPYGVSEWDISGLTPLYDCETVQCARVREAVFSIEGKVESMREFDSKATPGKKSATMVTIEGTRFWAREDAINADRNIIDPEVLRPISRLGGITYGRTTEAFEIPRPDFDKDLGGVEGAAKLESKHPAN
ncbi:hypothetical protein B0H63DRAFT_528620 [Podospora didyma]|uniref:Flavin reductase like domain-containing protein n=1 Tax=Podospora didyma TaxID=330526 RepID=A0AAE0N300_9PEZI|nr:hypothetical protein B0H63DRAFT_528620 [Podospora didyma]